MIEEIRRVYRELDRLLSQAGYGTISRIQNAAGVSNSYLRDLRSRLEAGQEKGYDLGVLLRILEALEVDRTIFFGRLYGLRDPIALCQLEARRLGEPPEIVAKVRDLLRLETWQPLTELPAAIRDLDAHRYRDANEAREIARGELVKVAADLAPLSWGIPLLAVYGSALRMTDAYDEALQALVTALEVAEPTGDLSTLGDLLQRLGFVVADRRGDYRRASALATRATDFHVRAGDLNSVGKTFVDRGLWQYKRGDLQEAIRMQQAALEYLEKDEHKNRCAAFHNLGVYHRKLCELEKAQEYALLARELTPHIGPLLVAKLQWLDARIAVDQRRYEEAEGLLRETIRAFIPSSPFEAARATTELVRVLLYQGRQDAAHETAETMARFIEPLENKSADAATATLDLMLAAQSDRGLTTAEADHVAAVLEEERERSNEHSRSGR